MNLAVKLQSAVRRSFGQQISDSRAIAKKVKGIRRKGRREELSNKLQLEVFHFSLTDPIQAIDGCCSSQSTAASRRGILVI